jgi:hypothetical protein
MNLWGRVILGAISFALSSVAVFAQTYHDTTGTVVPGVVIVNPTDNSGPLGTTSNPMKVSGAFSASLSGFTPTPSYASLSVTTSSSRVALPSGTTVVVYNTGLSDAYVTLGNSSVVAAASNDVIKAAGWMAFAVGSNTYLAAIGTSGATSITLSGGSGLPTGTGASVTPGSLFSEIVPNNTIGVSVKAAAGTVYSFSFSNNGATPFYVKLYNSAGAPTCGSLPPVARFEVPANSTPANGSGSNLPFGLPGVTFPTGIGICVTAGIADGDTTAPTAGVGVVNIAYQ